MIAEVEKNDAGFIIEAKVTRLKWRFAYTNFVSNIHIEMKRKIILAP